MVKGKKRLKARREREVNGPEFWGRRGGRWHQGRSGRTSPSQEEGHLTLEMTGRGLQLHLVAGQRPGRDWARELHASPGHDGGGQPLSNAHTCCPTPTHASKFLKTLAARKFYTASNL